MQNNLDTDQLRQEQMYEVFKDMSDEELESFQKSLKKYSEENHQLDNLKIALERIENERLREQFYWRLYYLIDEEDELTKLGYYYKLLYTHHYLKALKLYISMSDSLHEKNKVFTKNEKAIEYLGHFQYYVKSKTRQ